jgi:hypothetical protein
LLDFYFPGQGFQAVDSLKGLADELVELRNDLLKRSADSLPARDKHRQFKRRLVELLQAAGFLATYPLISVQGSQSQEGIKTHLCRLHVGFHDTFEPASLQCDLDLEKDRPALLNLRTGALLYLHPCYLLRPCPEAGCGLPHLFRLERAEKKGLDYVAAGGHRLRDAAAGGDWQTLLQGPLGLRLRHEAKYLCLEAAETRQPLLAGYCVKSKYVILEYLRPGGMADVYKVKSLATGEVLALKLLPYQFLKDRTLVQRFRQEALRARGATAP